MIATRTMIIAFDPVHRGFGASSTGATGEGFGWGAKSWKSPRARETTAAMERRTCARGRGGK
jgi:hypothetical protein